MLKYGIAIIVLLCVYVIFAGAQIALMKSNPLTLELKRDQKGKPNIHIAYLLDNPEVYWKTTIAILYTLNIVMVPLFLLFFQSFRWGILPDMIERYFVEYRYMIPVLAILFHLIFVQICTRFIARPIFRYRPENKVNFLSHLIYYISKLVVPGMNVLVKTSEFILVYLFNARINKNAVLFKGIFPQTFYRQSIQGQSVMDTLNKEFFRGAVDLTQVNVRKCITPRIEMVAISIDAGISELRQKFIDSGLSKIVVYDKHLDNIKGYVIHFDIHQSPSSISDILIQLPVVPEAMSALDVVKMFTRDRKSMALVLDEYGGTTGLVTMEDILEEIFGNIKDEYSSQEFVEKKLSDNEYIFSGRLKLDYLNQKYGLNFLLDTAETLSGYIIAKHESIPSVRQRIIIGMYEFEILLVTDTKIESIKVKILSH